MDDSPFLDTNILIYAIEVEGPDPDKSLIAAELAERKDAVLSIQVLGEFYRAATSKRRAQPLSHSEAVDWIQIWKRRHVEPLTLEHVNLALQIVAKFQVSYFDALIVAAARLAGCSTIYSEDLSDGQDYGGVMVRNPFATKLPLRHG